MVSTRGSCGNENAIKVDLSSIPEHAKEELAAATLDAVLRFLKQPGGREFLDNRKAEKNKK